jgi:hypothetical protein
MSTTILTLRIIRTSNGYMLEHNDEYVYDMHGDNCWDSLDDAMEEFSKLVLSDELMPARLLDIQPDCGTPALQELQDRIDNAVKNTQCKLRQN